MVLLIRGPGQKQSDPVSMKCVKKCGKRYHVLEDTERSVQELFSKVLKMVGNKKRTFFIPPAYEDFMETEFKPWEERRILKINTLLDEKDKLIKGHKKVDNYKQKKELKRDLDTSTSKETSLRKELDTSKMREHYLRMELSDFQQRDYKLRKQVNDYESEMTKLKEQLATSKSNQDKSRKNCDDLQISELKTKINAFQQRESELKKELEASQLRETELMNKFQHFRKDKSNPGSILDPHQQRESEVTKGDCCVEKDNTTNEPEPSGTRKHRRSKDLDHPNLSTDESYHYLDTF